jgi:hypothetical protein
MVYPLALNRKELAETLESKSVVIVPLLAPPKVALLPLTQLTFSVLGRIFQFASKSKPQV